MNKMEDLFPGLGAGLPGEPELTTPVVAPPAQEYLFPAFTDWYNPVTGERITSPSFRADGAPPKEGFIEVPSGGIPPGIEGLPGEPELTTPVVDPTQEAVDAAVTGDPAATGGGVDPTPDIQTLIDEWLASFTTDQNAQDATRQQAIDQAAAMTGQYTLTGPSIGYNPYESGQYASSPYGEAGVPEMGGITTIPVPATYSYKAPGTT